MSEYQCIIQLPKKYKNVVRQIIAEQGYPVEWHDEPGDVWNIDDFADDYASIWSWVPDWWMDKDKCQTQFVREIVKRYQDGVGSV